MILLGPSHHAHVKGIALSKFEKYGTPLGDIPLDLEGGFPTSEETAELIRVAIHELRQSGSFLEMNSGVDEDEHTLEMHLPYIRHVFEG